MGVGIGVEGEGTGMEIAPRRAPVALRLTANLPPPLVRRATSQSDASEGCRPRWEDMTDEEKHLEIVECMRDPAVRVAAESANVQLPRPSDWNSPVDARRMCMDTFVMFYVTTRGVRKAFLQKEMAKAADDDGVADDFWGGLDHQARRMVRSPLACTLYHRLCVRAAWPSPV